MKLTPVRMKLFRSKHYKVDTKKWISVDKNKVGSKSKTALSVDYKVVEYLGRNPTFQIIVDKKKRTWVFRLKSNIEFNVSQYWPLKHMGIFKIRSFTLKWLLHLSKLLKSLQRFFLIFIHTLNFLQTFKVF